MDMLLCVCALFAQLTFSDDLLLEKAFASYRDEPAKRVYVASVWGDPHVRLAVLQPEWPRVLHDDRDDAFRALYASHYLGALLYVGRSAEAVKVWDSLPPQTRKRVLAGGSARLSSDGEQVDRNLLDVHFDLASALALEKRGDDALELIRIDALNDEPLAKLVRAYVARETEVPAELVALFTRDHPPRLVHVLVFMELATGHGYDREARQAFHNATAHYRSDGGRPAIPDELLAEWKRQRDETTAFVTSR